MFLGKMTPMAALNKLKSVLLVCSYAHKRRKAPEKIINIDTIPKIHSRNGISRDRKKLRYW